MHKHTVNPQYVEHTLVLTYIVQHTSGLELFWLCISLSESMRIQKL